MCFKVNFALSLKTACNLSHDRRYGCGYASPADREIANSDTGDEGCHTVARRHYKPDFHQIRDVIINGRATHVAWLKVTNSFSVECEALANEGRGATPGATNISVLISVSW